MDKYINGKLRSLIRMCCLDINGLVRESDLAEVLPIEQNGLKIWIQDRKMFFDLEDEVHFAIDEEAQFFNSREILKRIMIKFGIFFNGELPQDVTRFQNEILQLLSK